MFTSEVWWLRFDLFRLGASSMLLPSQSLTLGLTLIAALQLASAGGAKFRRIIN
jgi:hypothetical protein